MVSIKHFDYYEKYKILGRWPGYSKWNTEALEKENWHISCLTVEMEVLEK